MKLSAWVSTSDLLNKKESGFGEFIFSKFIKQSIFSENDPKDVLKKLKKAGVNGIELLVSSNTKKEDIREIKNMLKELGLRIYSIHQSVSRLFGINLDEIRDLFVFAKDLGSEVIVLHLSVVGNKIFDEAYVNELKELEHKYSIKIGMENSPPNPLWLSKTYAWKEEEFCSVINNTGFNITFDVTHLAQIGKDIVDFYEKNKSKIVNIHLSDYKKSFLNNPLMLTINTHLPLGRGELPIKEILKVLKEDKYNGIITMEINGLLDELQEGARIIRKIYDN